MCAFGVCGSVRLGFVYPALLCFVLVALVAFGKPQALGKPAFFPYLTPYTIPYEKSRTMP